LKRFLGKDYLSGVMFIAFGVGALYFGQRLALGTPVRMGPGYVPRMLSLILLCLGSAIVLLALWRTAEKREKERWWLPLAGLTVLAIGLSMVPWGVNTVAGMLNPASKTAFVATPIPIAISAALLFDVLAVSILIAIFGRPGAQADDMTEPPAWKPIVMVTVGVICFALLFERAGLIPALIALVLIASLGGEEFKLTEVIGNMVVLAILCTLVFKVGLGMNITVLRGVW
jgi:hypothetical protein